MDLQFSFLQHEDWSIPRGIEVRIPLGDTQGEPGQAQYLGRSEELLFQLSFSLEMFKTRDVGICGGQKRVLEVQLEIWE